ncbi:MAG: cyclic nucleotide-binding domain-containing protein [Desulfofustis sp.]|nr:cyclic nucleotide-binding domain-containing protein [Desulfofustis sp.]
MNSSTERSADHGKQSVFKQNLEYLREIPLFQGVDYECLKLLTMLSKQIDLIEGDRLMVQGEDDGCAYYLLSGNLKSSYRIYDRLYQLSDHPPGQFLGGLSLLGPAIRLFTLYASEKSSVLRLKRDGFQKVMDQYPDGMVKVAANLPAVLRAWEQDLLNQIVDEEQETGNQALGVTLL